MMTPALWLGLFSLMIFRYWLGPEILIYALLRSKAHDRFRIQPQKPQSSQITREKHWTWISMFFDIFIFAGIFVVGKSPHSKLYWNIDFKSWGYWIFSIAALAVFQDVYFYLTHRLLHTKFMMRNVHRIHHGSTNPTPWSSFNVHPIEKLIELFFFPIVILTMPLHPGALIAYSFFSAFSNLMGHCGYEFSKYEKLMISPYWPGATSTFHNQHHQYFECNYSLYFSFWDKLFRTQHPNYAEDFSQVVKRRESFVSES